MLSTFSNGHIWTSYIVLPGPSSLDVTNSFWASTNASKLGVILELLCYGITIRFVVFVPVRSWEKRQSGLNWFLDPFLSRWGGLAQETDGDCRVHNQVGSDQELVFLKKYVLIPKKSFSLLQHSRLFSQKNMPDNWKIWNKFFRKKFQMMNQNLHEPSRKPFWL